MPVVTPIWDRGAVSRPMPEYLGVIGAASGGPAVLADADMILLIGSRVDYRVGYLKPPAVSASARVVRIDRIPWSWARAWCQTWASLAIRRRS